MANDFTDKAHQYCLDVTQGRIPAGKLEKAACRRHLVDLQKQKTKKFAYIYNKQKANQACDFIQQLPHIKGEWAGKTIELEPWQCFIVCSIFGWVKKANGKRRFREAYIEVPRKNGKSLLAAGIGLFMLTEDGEPGAEVYAGATTEEQAREVFNPARLMAKRAAGFAEHYGIKIEKDAIYDQDGATKFKPLSGKPGDGQSPHCAIVDEYHEHKTDTVYDAMSTGMGARSQPLLFAITTAGIDISGPCYAKRNEAIKILNKVFDNEHLFTVIFTLDEDDDWTDFRLWRKANPNIGVSASIEYLQDKLLTAKNNVSKQNIIRCKHLNQWMNASVAWMDMIKWRRCSDTTLILEDFKGKQCQIACDLATKIDLTAKVYLFEVEGDYYVFSKFYCPEETVIKTENDHYQRWVAEGWITQTYGDVLDFDQFQEDLEQDCKDFDVQHIGFDPWQAQQLINNLKSVGAPVLEYGNNVANVSEPMKQVQALVYSAKMHHNGNPVMNWMMSNVVAKVDFKDNIFPRKEFPENKIDGPVALNFALGINIIHGSRYITGYENGITFG